LELYDFDRHRFKLQLVCGERFPHAGREVGGFSPPSVVIIAVNAFIESIIPPVVRNPITFEK
jgi:hypothetical protein